MVIKLAIATIVWRFDIEFVEEVQKEPTYEDGFFIIRGPLPLRITTVPRE